MNATTLVQHRRLIDESLSSHSITASKIPQNGSNGSTLKRARGTADGDSHSAAVPSKKGFFIIQLTHDQLVVKTSIVVFLAKPRVAPMMMKSMKMLKSARHTR